MLFKDHNLFSVFGISGDTLSPSCIVNTVHELGVLLSQFCFYVVIHEIQKPCYPCCQCISRSLEDNFFFFFKFNIHIVDRELLMNMGLREEMNPGYSVSDLNNWANIVVFSKLIGKPREKTVTWDRDLGNLAMKSHWGWERASGEAEGKLCINSYANDKIYDNFSVIIPRGIINMIFFIFQDILFHWFHN